MLYFLFQFNQAGLSLGNEEMYLGKGAAKYEKAYKKYVEEVLILLGTSSSKAYSFAQDIWNMEVEIAKVCRKLLHKDCKEKFVYIRTCQLKYE